MATERILTRNVFVAGGNPDVTYNPRDARRLEADIREFMAQSGKALSVSGPTKSGKTVLIQRLLPESQAIWLHGSDIADPSAFWRAIVDWFGMYDTIELTDDRAVRLGAEGSVEGGVPGFGKVSATASGDQTTASGARYARTRTYSDLARERLATTPVPIVIDDFHYIPEAARREISRAIKTLIRIVPVVMIAVPHEAFDAVTQEPEMGGRVWHLKITLWTEDELACIAEAGFAALGIVDLGGAVTQRLAASSFGAPFLMQQLCFDICAAHEIYEAQHDTSPVLSEPDGGWDGFFLRIAERSVPPVFEMLRKGPKVRGQERIARVFKDGRQTDIYGAVLSALAEAGPKPATPQPELVRILTARLEEPARGQHISSALAQMSEIADDARGDSDPALVFKSDEVYILDPFLLFYLRFGDWSMESYTGTAR
ncbi:MAG: hypothetical protein M0Z51_14725 [Propionibacterium sp.]|nr:hypothetical protein [Propionibacterium sp.]